MMPVGGIVAFTPCALFDRISKTDLHKAIGCLCPTSMLERHARGLRILGRVR